MLDKNKIINELKNKEFIVRNAIYVICIYMMMKI